MNIHQLVKVRFVMHIDHIMLLWAI